MVVSALRLVRPDPPPPARAPRAARWRFIPAATARRAVALASRFLSSRRDAARTGRALGRVLRDAQRGKPGPKSSDAEIRQRLTEYGRLVRACGISRGTAVNLQYLAAIPARDWARLMRQGEVPPLTRLYATGRACQDGPSGLIEGAAFTDAIPLYLAARMERIPALVDAVRDRALANAERLGGMHYFGWLNAPAVRAAHPGLQPIRELAAILETLDKHARLDASRGKR
jgi:hypothetical protein